jgi:hypothetical protein
MTITRSAAELLARASSRERVTTADARSGAVFERIVVGPECYFVKHLGFAPDNIAAKLTAAEVLHLNLPASAGRSYGARCGSRYRRREQGPGRPARPAHRDGPVVRHAGLERRRQAT